MKRVVTIRVEERYDNGAPLERGGFASREYHFPLTLDSPEPSAITDRLHEVLTEELLLR